MSDSEITVTQTDGMRIRFAALDSRVRSYWKLIKSWQTGLLIISGLAGYMSAGNQATNWRIALMLALILFLSISGSTVLNMVYDRDIDAKMLRTCRRPLPSGVVSVRESLILGLLLSASGLIWAFLLSPLFGAVIAAGLFFDMVIYTIWLKRRTPWAIIWGGIAGGMPVLAGRVLGIGHLDAIGLMLTLAVLFWIPTHIVTFSIKYKDDYRKAGVPVFPNTHSEKTVQIIIGLSTCLSVAALLLSAWQMGLQPLCRYIIIALGVVLIACAVISVLGKSTRLNFALFKMASVYMLATMLIIMLDFGTNW